LWRTPIDEELALFQQGIRDLRLTPLGLSRYSMRHGGVSHDLLERRRALAEVKRRGRWMADASLRRYAKETRLLSELRKVAPEVVAYGRAVLSMLPGLLVGRPPPSPPA